MLRKLVPGGGGRLDELFWLARTVQLFEGCDDVAQGLAGVVKSFLFEPVECDLRFHQHELQFHRQTSILINQV